jgi:hypothetical protein
VRTAPGAGTISASWVITPRGSGGAGVTQDQTGRGRRSAPDEAEDGLTGLSTARVTAEDDGLGRWTRRSHVGVTRQPAFPLTLL